MQKKYLVPETKVVRIAVNTHILSGSAAAPQGLEGVTSEEYTGDYPVSWSRSSRWSDDD